MTKAVNELDRHYIKRWVEDLGVQDQWREHWTIRAYRKPSTGFHKYGHILQSPQRHKDAEKMRIKKSFIARFLCVFVSLW
jgi:hypothetical protein